MNSDPTGPSIGAVLMYVNTTNHLPAIGRLALSLAAILLVGCGGDGLPRVAVEGSVSLDGSPLPAGVIRFIPSDDSPATAAVIHEGKFALPKREGPVVGPHRVEIEATEHLDFDIDDEAAFAAHAQANRGRPLKNPIPPIYNKNSTLTAQITADGEREFHFSLESNPR